MTISKLGVHGLGSGPTLIGPTLGKWVNADPPATGLPSGYTCVWRWVENPDSLDGEFNNPNPEALAQAWVDRQWEHIKFVPKTVITSTGQIPVYISGSNETHPTNAIMGMWFGRFEIARMKIMESRGYRCAIGSFGTGHPPLGQDDGWGTWASLLPMMRYAKANGHILDLHEYSYSVDGFNMGRYRLVYAWLPADARPGLVIGEWGLDGDKGAFRESRWRDQYANPDAVYFELMRAYDLDMQKYPYALGFTVYTSPSDNNWKRFELNGPVIDMMRNYFQSIPPTLPIPPPQPIPIPVPVAPFLTFTADNLTLVRGQSTTLHWNSGNIISLFLNGQGVTGNEDRQVSPVVTTLYTLKANHSLGQLVRSILIEVKEPPMTPTSLQNGSFNAIAADPNPARWPAEYNMSGLKITGWELEAWSKSGDTKLFKQDTDWRVPEILPIEYIKQFPEDALRYDKGDNQCRYR